MSRKKHFSDRLLSYDDPRLDVPVVKEALVTEPMRVYRNGEPVIIRPSKHSQHTRVDGVGTLTWRETLILLTEGLLAVGRVQYSLSHPTTPDNG